MQCSACRPTVSASTSRAPVVEQDEVELLRPVARGDAGPHRRVGVHPLAGRRARQQLQEDLEVAPASAASFSMPMTVISVSGRVRHIRPLPSDSTTASVPVSATPKLAPEIATLARRNFSRRCSRAASASSRGIVGQAVGRRPADLAISARKMSRISVRLRWMAGTRMWRGQVVRRAGRSARPGRSPRRRCPAAARASLSPISWVAIDLTLTTSSAPVAADDAGHDPVGLGGVAGPVDDAAARGHRAPRAGRAAPAGRAGRRP